MIPKMALAFVLGGAAVGVAVYLGMRNPAPTPAPAPVPVAAAQPAAPLPPVVALPVETPAPAPAPPAPAPRPAPRKSKAAPAPQPVQVAKADPLPAPPPHVPVIASPQPVTISPSPAPEPAPIVRTAPPTPAPRQPKTVTIPAGTLITVRLRDTLSSERNTLDENFTATLDAPLIVDGFVIAERGSVQRGRIIDLARSGRVKGRALLAVALTQITTADGQQVDIRTDTFRREAESGVKSDAAKTGVAAGIGAAIGAMAGGGKGAGIGAILGGAAGAGGAMATRGKPAELPSETRLTFRLNEPVTLTEKLN